MSGETDFEAPNIPCLDLMQFCYIFKLHVILKSSRVGIYENTGAEAIIKAAIYLIFLNAGCAEILGCFSAKLFRLSN